MFQTVISGIVYGVSGLLIRVEVDLRNGLPYFSMVGFLSQESKEARERVESALRSAGFPIPPMKITVNLSPANIRKAGTAFDFPIAAAMLAALGLIPSAKVKDVCFLGELGLDGSIYGTGQSLPIIREGIRQGIHTFLISTEDYEMLEPMETAHIIPMKHLSDIISYFNDQYTVNYPSKTNTTQQDMSYSVDFADMTGQFMVKRACEIAAAGHHHILLVGSPGSGKTMAAQRLVTIMKPLNHSEKEEVDSIYCAMGMHRNPAGDHIPFRSPHSSISVGGMIGGGTVPKGGEITLAHHGILFLDEMTLFKSGVLEALRQPLEEKKLILNRLGRSYVFPADFLLAATMNPCPCGYSFTPEKCRCTLGEKRRYLHKISGPLLDRFDMIVPVPDMTDCEEREKETSQMIQERVIAASEYLNQHPLAVDTKGMNHMKELLAAKSVSRRGFDRVIHVARTIAALERSKQVEQRHVIEAYNYRDLSFLTEVLDYE